MARHQQEAVKVGAAVYRRPKRLVAYWQGETFVVHPYMRGSAFAADASLVTLLAQFSVSASAANYAEATGVSLRAATRLLDNLAAAGLLEKTNVPVAEEDIVWDVWNEAAAFLHFSTRNRRFATTRATTAGLVARAARQPPPPSTKSYRDRLRVVLPSVGNRSAFDALAARRRTWRQFGAGQTTLQDLSAVLGVTFRAQRWLDLGASGRLMLRSSPSGGARHPTEAYVLVRRVKGLPSGVYYYAPAEHALARLGRARIGKAEITKLLVGQSCYSKASVLVCMTAVFARKAWAYPSARAYKSILLELGHFCQTFCLAATARNLAPFCTGAFAEWRIERALGLKATEESVMYVAGFGVRPPGVSWAPLPEDETPLDL